MSAPAQPHGYIYVKPTDSNYLRALVWQYRRNEAALRRLYGHYVEGQGGTTNTAILRREHDRNLADSSVATFGDGPARMVIGWLVVERKLLVKIARAKQHNIVRPELRKSLAQARRELRAFQCDGRA